MNDRIFENDYNDLLNAEFLRYHYNVTVIPYLVPKCVLALVSRVGFIFIEVGSIPVENVYTIVLYNLFEISVGILLYGLVGNLIAFRRHTAIGWISLGRWKWDDVSSMTQDAEAALLGFCSVLLSTAQMSSFVIGRINLAGGMLLTALYSGVFQPFLMHWIWHERGWMKLSRFLDLYVSVQDHAGALALHIPSVIFGMTGSLFLGRRILKLKEIDKLSFGSEIVVISLIGYLLIILDYIIFALPMYETSNNYNALIFINSFLAVAAGIFTVTILQLIIFRDIHRHRRIIRSIQGGVAGLISIAAAVNLYPPSITIIISILSSIIFFFFAELIHNTALEDPCCFISSHLVCGFIGVMVCSLVAHNGNLGNTVRIEILGVHLLWQFVCTCVVISISFIVALFVFLLLKIFGILKNNFEITNHKRATVLRDALPKRGYLERLFKINNTTDYVIPGYWKSYFDANRASDKVKSANVADISLSDGDKMRENGTLQERKIYSKEFNTNNITMQVSPGKIPAKLDTNWQMYGSGDYNPYAQIKKVYNINNPINIAPREKDTVKLS